MAWNVLQASCREASFWEVSTGVLKPQSPRGMPCQVPAGLGSQVTYPSFSDVSDLCAGGKSWQPHRAVRLNGLLMLLKCLVRSKEAIDQGSVYKTGRIGMGCGLARGRGSAGRCTSLTAGKEGCGPGCWGQGVRGPCPSGVSLFE